MGIGLLYSVDEKYKNNQLIYDFERGEVIDPETGEVLEDHLIESTPSIRADDYAEWNLKRQHEVLVEEKDRKLRSIVYRIGKRIGAPSWLCEDVLVFLKRSRKLRSNPLIGENISILNEKSILAAFYVVALKRCVIGIAERIAKMDCGGVPCYLNRRRKDKEFHKYVILLLKLWFIMNKGSSYMDEIRSYIGYFVEAARKVDNEINIVGVASRSMELLEEYRGKVGSYKPRNLAVALVISAITSMYGKRKANSILGALVREYNVNELSDRNILNKLSHLGNEGGG